MDDLVSVVIPLYNAREWIEDCLSSVTAQITHLGDVKVEVIVIDDGSTDDCAAIARRTLADSNVVHQIIRTVNGGPSRARNCGLQSARGEWVQFLDADDWLRPNKIAFQYAFARKSSPSVAFLYSPWQRVGYRGESWQTCSGVADPQLDPDPAARLLTSEHFIQLGAALFRRSWLCAVHGFSDDNCPIEDVNLMLRLVFAGGQCVRVSTDGPVAFYRQVNGSFSRANQRRFVEGCIKNARLAESCWRAANELSANRIDVLTNVYFEGARFFAAVDQAAFESMLGLLHTLRPRFIAPHPAHLRLASRLIGYRRAEQLAVWYRSRKSWLRRLLERNASRH